MPDRKPVSIQSRESIALLWFVYFTDTYYYMLQDVHIKIISLRPPMETYKSYVHLTLLILNGTYTETLPDGNSGGRDPAPLLSQRTIILRHS